MGEVPNLAQLFACPPPIWTPQIEPPYSLQCFTYHSMHCIIVLATLFVTSCYWSAVPANTISSEVFDRLNITLTNSTDPLWSPSNGARELKWDQPIQLLSRCWCDFTRTPFFDNLDVQAWEKDSVLVHPVPAPLEPSASPSGSGGGVSHGRMGAGSVPGSELDNGSKNSPLGLTRRLLGYVVPKRFFRQSQSTANLSTSAPGSTSASTSSSVSATNTTKRGGGFMYWLLQKGDDKSDKPPAPPSPRQPARISNTNLATATPMPPPPEGTPPTLPPKSVLRPLFIPTLLLRPITHWRFRWPSRTTGKVQGPKLPWFRRRYDLRRHGIGIVLDFGWGRGENGERIGPA